MEPAVLAAQVGLAAVFGIAALTKLADRAGTQAGLVAFGVPPRPARPLAVLVPIVELAAAAALLAPPTGRWGAIGAIALLVVFTAAIVGNLVRGRAPECRCFGRVHSAPVSWWTVGRNTLLAATATVLLADAAAALAPAALAGALAATLLERRQGARASRALPIGAAAPAFRLQALHGGAVTHDVLRAAGRPVLLLFSDPRCGPCSALAPRWAEWQRDLAGELPVWIAARGEIEETRAKAAEHGLANVLLDADDELATAFGARGTPSAVLLGADGRVASEIAVGGYEIELLVAEATGAAPPAPPPAAPARAQPSLTRLELLARAGAAAAVVLLGVRDAWAGGPPALVLKCKYVRCGNRCCPRTAVCGRRRGKRVCICPDGREACGSRCCKETFVCKKNARGKKVCVCPPRTRLCAGRCVPLTDPAHCGACGSECPPATSCVNGQCVGGDGTGTGPGGALPCTCPHGETCCDGGCVDLNTNALHCGRCDVACPPGQTCCDGACKDLQSDPANCGECGKRCPPGKVCVAGRCRESGGGGCPPGLTRCGERCVDLLADNANCGECGRNCAEGLTCCGEADCVDLRIRPDHCTACYRVCPSPYCTCWNSKCSGPVEYGCWDGGIPFPGRRRTAWKPRALRRGRHSTG